MVRWLMDIMDNLTDSRGKENDILKWIFLS